jgi:hypothetical protein
MRFVHHVVASTLASGLLIPILGPMATVPWAASLVADVDHYLWYVWHYREGHPGRALDYFTHEGERPSGWAFPFHHPLPLVLLLAGGVVVPLSGLLGLGLAFHLALDGLWDLLRPWRLTRGRERRAALRLAALRRDDYRCQVCGAHGVTLIVHHILPRERGGPDRLANMITLCETCHTEAHRISMSDDEPNPSARSDGRL